MENSKKKTVRKKENLFRNREFQFFLAAVLFLLLAVVFLCLFLGGRKQVKTARENYEVKTAALMAEGRIFFTDSAISETAQAFLTTAFTKDESFQKMRENCAIYTDSESVLYYLFPENSYNPDIIPEVTLSDFQTVVEQTSDHEALCHVYCKKNEVRDGAEFSYTLQCKLKFTYTDSRWKIDSMSSFVQY